MVKGSLAVEEWFIVKEFVAGFVEVKLFVVEERFDFQKRRYFFSQCWLAEQLVLVVDFGFVGHYWLEIEFVGLE